MDRNEEIGKYLLECGVKPTAMRILVYRVLEQCKHPISLKQMEDRMVTADRSTIFRTLNLLLKNRNWTIMQAWNASSGISSQSHTIS